MYSNLSDTPPVQLMDPNAFQRRSSQPKKGYSKGWEKVEVKPIEQSSTNRLELKDRSITTLQEFGNLAKETSSSLELSQEFQRVGKTFANLEPSWKNGLTILNRMKESMHDVHQSNEGILEALKTLPAINDGLKIEDLVKNP